ncbi:MAG TPA: lyase family protein [Solirubrobacteraceae bacterium]|nr:lyase family protein [Solirubrobacteraceae bacterium]
MTSEPGLFGGIYARGAVAAEVSDRAWLQAMLDVEAALARACAAESLIPGLAADEIADACRADRFDIAALGRDAADSATPVVALVKALRAAVAEPAREHVHLGATSQDIADTALMLIARRALEPLLDDASAAADAAAGLAGAHRDTPMIGRTLLQQAVPVTFGLRAAGWLTGLDSGRRRLRQVRDGELAVQMGGPVGARAPAVAARVATELGLAEPVMPWQAIRLRPVTLAAALGAFDGVLAKIARDVTLLAQQEVAEVTEGGGADRGGSSAMAHKRNPVGAVSVLACTKRTPGLVATALAAMEQEHERAAGAWQAEWGTYTELVALTGSATAWTRELLENLSVDAERMGANLAAAATGDQPVPEGAGELVDRALEAHRA